MTDREIVKKIQEVDDRNHPAYQSYIDEETNTYDGRLEPIIIAIRELLLDCERRQSKIMDE